MLRNFVQFGKYSLAKFAKFLYICITRGKAYCFPTKFDSNVVGLSQMYTNFENIAWVCFPYFTTFRNQTWVYNRNCPFRGSLTSHMLHSLYITQRMEQSVTLGYCDPLLQLALKTHFNCYNEKHQNEQNFQTILAPPERPFLIQPKTIKGMD